MVSGRGLASRLAALTRRLSEPAELVRVLTEPAGALTRLADRYGSDKGSRVGGNRYARVYEALFGPLRDRPVRLLEIGLLGRGHGWDEDSLRDIGQACGHDAPSLRMWADYFRGGEIFGLDFNDFSSVRIDRCRILRGDMGRPDDLNAVLDVVGNDLDIVIDDASHASHDQQLALGMLFPAVRPGGFYVIEDLTFQPASRERPDAVKTLDVLRRAEFTGAFEAPHISREASNYLEQHVERVALFDAVGPGSALESRDSLAVLWKKS